MKQVRICDRVEKWPPSAAVPLQLATVEQLSRSEARSPDDIKWRREAVQVRWWYRIDLERRRSDSGKDR